MRLLLLGGGWLLGRRLAIDALARGWEVSAFSRGRTALPGPLRYGTLKAGCELAAGDALTFALASSSDPTSTSGAGSSSSNGPPVAGIGWCRVLRISRFSRSRPRRQRVHPVRDRVGSVGSVQRSGVAGSCDVRRTHRHLL